MEKIIVLVILSSMIAWLGDILGKYIGKKRLSLFNLRPKQTAVMTTVVTGGFITLFSLVFFALTFEEVRIALFNIPQLRETVKNYQKEVKNLNVERIKLDKHKNDMEKEIQVMKKNISDRENKVLEMDKEIVELKNSRDGLTREASYLKDQIQRDILKIGVLEKELKRKEKGFLVYKKNEPIVVTILKTGLSAVEILEKIKELLQTGRNYAVTKGLVTKTDFDKTWKVVKEKFESVVNSTIKKTDKDLVIGLIASVHLFKGDEILGTFYIEENRKLVNKEEVLEEFTIDGTQDKESVFSIIDYYFKKIGKELKLRGRLGNSEVGMLKFYELFDGVLNKKTKVKIIAKENIFVEGEYRLKFEFNYDE
ncbi:DUF3084 domain-containing protein [bacterium]|nr:DUF3084 domain-containing protein [bacterium]